jgi:tetratricopeptide (TPR) repeat protein
MEVTYPLETARSACDLAPDTAWFHLDAAAEYRALGRLHEATQCCHRALALDGELADAYRLLGFIAQDRGDQPAAIDALENALRIGKPDQWTLYALADSYRAQGHIENALSLYHAALAVTPDFPEALRQIGMIERARGNEQIAVEYFQTALPHFEQAAAISGGAALLAPIELLLLLNNTTEARVGLDRLTHLASDSAFELEIHSLHAQLAELTHDPLSEIEHRRAMVRLRPQAAWIWQALIDRLIAARMHAEALNTIDAALIHLPGDVDLLIERARALRLAGRADEATDQLRTIPADNHASPQSHVKLANEFRALSMPEQASKAAEAAISIAPHFVWGHLIRAYVALEQRGPSAGMERFRLVLSQFPDDPEATRQVSQLLRDRGDAAAARDFLLERGISANAPLELFTELVVCLCQTGEIGRARALLAERKSLKRVGDDPTAAALEIELSSGDIRALGELISTVRHQNTDSAAILSRVVRAAHAVNDFEAVIRTYRDWMERDRSRALYCLLAIADAEFHLGRLDAALARLASAQQTYGHDPDLSLTLGRILRRSGQLDDAGACLSTASRQFPHHTVLWEEHVRLCIQTNRLETARELLARANENDFARIATRDLLAIELDLERRDIDSALERIQRFRPASARHRALHDHLSFRAHFAALDLPAARASLASELTTAKVERKLRRQSSNVSQSLMGQILDDYRLDQQSIDHLIAIRARPLSEQTEPLFDQIRHHPGSTAVAITTLLHLRQAGFFTRPAHSGNTSIPRRIAQFWHHDAPPFDIARYMQSWVASNGDWHYELFSSSSAGAFIARHCSGSVLAAYRQSQDATTKADLFRLAWLCHSGGVYVDADDAATGAIDRILGPATKFAVHQEDTGSIGNNFIAVVPGHPVIEAALAEAATSILRGDRDIVWLSTGPGLLSRVFVQWLAAQTEGLDCLLDEIVVLDRAEFTSVCAPHCHAAYKLTASHWAKGLFG